MQVFKQQPCVKIFKGFRVIPNELKSSELIPNNEKQTVKISKLQHLSPLKKIAKPTTPVKYVHMTIDSAISDIEIDDELWANFEDMSLLLTASQTEPCFVINTDQFKETDIETIEDIIQKIPFVLDELKSENQTEVYVKFTTLLAERKMPLSNIAHLLFVDVVEWFSFLGSI